MTGGDTLPQLIIDLLRSCHAVKSKALSASKNPLKTDTGVRFQIRQRCRIWWRSNVQSPEHFPLPAKTTPRTDLDGESVPLQEKSSRPLLAWSGDVLSAKNKPGPFYHLMNSPIGLMSSNPGVEIYQQAGSVNEISKVMSCQPDGNRAVTVIPAYSPSPLTVGLGYGS